MQYIILATETADAFAARADPERSGEYWSAWTGYIEALAQSGVMVSAGGLQPPDVATTVRLQEGRRTVQDGPYADTKEQLGGYFVVDVADLDAALEWAGKCAAACEGPVELRPMQVDG